MECTNHPTEQANFLITNLADGDTLSACPACLVDFCRAVVAQTDAAAAAEAAEADGNGTGAEHQQRPAAGRRKAAGGGRGRSGAADAVDRAAEVPPPAETAAEPGGDDRVEDGQAAVAGTG